MIDDDSRDPHDAITLAHGNGGRRSRRLVDSVFAARLGNDTGADAARLPAGGPIAFTSDSFTVRPLFFPGGDIGSLAVNGTVNDLAVSGARPRWLSLNAIVEEGFALADLERVAASVAAAADAAGVAVVTGDTKVVGRGEVPGLFLASSGVGECQRPLPGMAGIEPGDRVLVSGPVGDHGAAVMLAREAFGIRGDLASDCAGVWPLCAAALESAGLRFMRDPTRGGLATVAHEIAAGCGRTVRLDESAIPVSPAARGVCELLGFDPLYLACEGRVVAVAAPGAAAAVLAAWRALPAGEAAAEIGAVHPGPARVELVTELGGRRVLPELEDDPLPRIC